MGLHEQALTNLRWLEKYNIELIEQPLPRDQLEGLGEVQRRTKIPIVADESVQTMHDIELLGRAGVRGINLKLMKLGGILAALRCLKRHLADVVSRTMVADAVGARPVNLGVLTT